jgi:predicted Zn-dependent protease
MFKRVAFIGVSGLALIGAALPMVQLPGAQSISVEDKATGAKAHAEQLDEFGGVYNGPQAAMVRRVGLRVAGQSGIANTDKDLTITLLNSPAENAFAIPGGYVYCTRALLALMNDEAELAFALGHETGHIAAHHSEKRQKVANRDVAMGSIGQALLGGLLGNSTLGKVFGSLGNAGINRMVVGHVMSHSRAEEFEADDLGVIYNDKAGYDPRAGADMLAQLAAQNTLDQQLSGDARSTPKWAMSHPDPAGRVVRAGQRAGELNSAQTYRNNDAFLLALKGMLYGDDPKQGVIEGNSFLYPTGLLQFSAPDGYGMANGADAVSIGAKGSGVSGTARFSGGRYDGNLNSYVDAVFTGMSKSKTTVHVNGQTGSINGIPTLTAQTRASDASGNAVDVTVVAYAFSANSAYSFVVMQAAGRGLGDLAGLVQSLRKMSAGEAAAVRPRIVDVVSVKRGDSLASLAARMAYPTLQAERFMVLNAIAPGTTVLPVGRKVKLIIWGKNS